MKKYLLLIIALAAFSAYVPALVAQTGYSVDIVVDDHWWESDENFGVWLRAVISHNGNPIPNSNDYYYRWWLYFSHEGYWKILTSGFGEDEAVPETHQGWTFVAYVVVTDSVHHTFSGIISNTVGPFTAPGDTGQFVSFAPLRQDGVNILGTVMANHWRYTIGQWRGYTPYPFLTRYNNEVIEATPRYVSSLEQKSKYWNGDIANILNHNAFYVSGSFDLISPQYWSAEGNVAVKANLIDAPGITGSIQFRDPWYVDSLDAEHGSKPMNRGMQKAVFRTRESTAPDGFKPNFDTPFPPLNHPYRGVFLDQPIVSGRPYYSVGAPNPNTIAGFEAFFVRWDDSQPTQVVFQNAAASQTGVVFKQSGATATAKYKAHLASSTTQAISNPSQRKIIRTGSQMYFACYESGGHVWLTRSTDGGLNWSNEVRMSDELSGFTNRSPAVSMSFLSPTRVVVAWEAAGWYLGNYQNRIYVRAIDPNAFTTVEHKTIITVQAPYQFSAMPALAPSYAQSTSPTLLAFYDPSVPGIKGYVVDYATSATLFQSGVVSFSIAPNDFGAVPAVNPTWTLAWSDGTTVYRGYCEKQGFSLVPSSPSVFVENISGTGVGEISMVRIRDAGAGHYGVSWIDNGMSSGPGLASSYSIRFREFYGGPITVWPDVWGSVASPSLTHNYGSFGLALVWQGASSVYFAQRLSGIWYATSSLGPGTTPSVSVPQWGAAGGTSDIVLSRGITGAPYAIQRAQISYASDEEEEDGIASGKEDKGARFSPTGFRAAREGRGGYIEFPNGSMNIVLLSATVDGEPLQFPSLKDSITVTNRRQIDSAATTLPLNGVGMLEATLLYKTKGIIPSGAQVAFEIRDAFSGSLLQKVRIFQGREDTVVTFRVPLNHIGRFVTIGLASTNMSAARRFVLEQWLLPEENENTQHLMLAKANATPALPTVFALRASYPNPFNPSTTISYDLPEVADVSLVIYDVVGREVAEIVHGTRAAGYHSATWNASSAASGVYFARFAATDGSGNIRLNKVSKLVLTK